MYELKSVGNRSDDYDDCDSTRESKILDMEEGESIKKGDIYTKKVSISSSNFFVGNNKSTSNGEKKMKQISDSKTFKRKVTTKDIVNCPKEYHANFISMFLFIIGSAFFRFPILYVAGCIIFAIASAMCLYSNLISAMYVKNKKKKEFYGFLCYIAGCAIFILGSVYCCFKDDYFAVITFILGSFYFLVGAIFFLYNFNLRNIKGVKYQIVIVYMSNLFGGLIFTVASIMFFYEHLYNYACYLYVGGSILFTLGTWFDYIIHVRNTF
ncbi:hypothetical protein MKS88_004865 [Plasmodium brasilianum]|uniref:YrhK domain-containing protein n=2 Tax=Plasmodium (Plasmodium) TaxID=418103 RepID=A0A1D3TCJ2_PLAMA|nr:conserved Plasmodium protein, unknown function [Plasmodium malariae]KAI4835652.1 hypothetical protein MKS88_004865 [Plasmodium brasilianum]SCP02581.1 conserved Plasmodium protein, unknown function [Plasmodium malariae]